MGNQKFIFLSSSKKNEMNFFKILFRQANFKTSLRAIELLFRTVTGEDWNRVLHDCMFRPDCNIPPGANFWETDCGSSFLSIVYFCSFYVIITYIGKNGEKPLIHFFTALFAFYILLLLFSPYSIELTSGYYHGKFFIILFQ